eukprot:353618-Chlamydomonas_euryale.AAC.5
MPVQQSWLVVHESVMQLRPSVSSLSPELGTLCAIGRWHAVAEDHAEAVPDCYRVERFLFSVWTTYKVNNSVAARHLHCAGAVTRLDPLLAALNTGIPPVGRPTS